MTWNAFHDRGEVLRTVVDAADARPDGLLPMELPGVQETFRDELDLLAALQLKWHARLSGNLERELMSQPADLEDAVAHAWHRTGQELPGIRRIIDHYSESPTGTEMATALKKANAKEWAGLATAAGLANGHGARAAQVGMQLAMRARTRTIAAPENGDEPGTPSLVERIKAVLAA